MNRALDAVLWSLTLLVCVVSLQRLPVLNGVSVSLGCGLISYGLTVEIPNLWRALRG